MSFNDSDDLFNGALDSKWTSSMRQKQQTMTEFIE
jgi:hypothetical protein